MAGASRPAAAQKVSVVEGAPDLALPTGAQSLGMGQAAVASPTGAEGLWWNPAAVAHGSREFAFLYERTIATASGADLAVAIVYPVPRVGAFALSVRYLNFGSQESTDSTGALGTFVTTSRMVAATFAPILTDRLSGGLTGKILSIGYDCTGSCSNSSSVPVTGAFDAGLVLVLTADSLVTLGAAVRNLGLPLQVNDAPQADALPSRLDVGLSIAPKLVQWPDARVRVSADVVTRAGGGTATPGFRFGAEGAWNAQIQGQSARVQGRAGYVRYGPGEASGFTFGFGVSTGRWQVDFAEWLSDAASQSGTTPVYLTLRRSF